MQCLYKFEDGFWRVFVYRGGLVGPLFLWGKEFIFKIIGKKFCILIYGFYIYTTNGVRMNILLGCEESQAVTIELRRLGHNAFSCDLQECSGGHPEWHFQIDIFKVIGGGLLVTQSGEMVEIKKWDMMVAFPPCTFLSFAGNGYFDINKYGQAALDRWRNRVEAMQFFMDLYNADIPRIAIENPMGFPFSAFRKPDQTIEPFHFGDSDKKRTCLWLKNLPKLIHVNHPDLFGNSQTHVEKPGPVYVDKVSGKKRYKTDAISGFSKDAQKLRSKTFPGIAKAMAEQWGSL